MRLAIADERLRLRNMPHLASLRGREGALVTSTGRIIIGALRNQIGSGWTPVDGYGYINAEKAVTGR